MKDEKYWNTVKKLKNVDKFGKRWLSQKTVKKSKEMSEKVEKYWKDRKLGQEVKIHWMLRNMFTKKCWKDRIVVKCTRI